MRDTNLYILKPLWKEITTNQLSLKSIHFTNVFICSDINIFNSLQEKGFKVFLISLMNNKNEFNAQLFIQEITTIINLSTLNKHIGIINILGWGDDSSHIINDPLQLENFIKVNFLLFKSVTSLEYPINYFFLKSSLSPISGIVEGLGLSISKENHRLKFFSLEVSSPEELDFNIILNRVYNLDIPIIKVEESKLLELQFEQINDINNDQKIIKKQKTYLITGHGKIARLLSKYLYDEYKAKIIIFGRRELDQEEEVILQNAAVDSYFKVDIGNIEELRLAWEYCIKEYEVIDGIFHLAGFLNDKLFVNKDYEDFVQVLYPKIQCTINLDLVSSQTPLDLFVCFSSITGTVGNIGQSDYATANGFLKSWCHYRTNLSQSKKRYGKTFCLDWGLWQDGGMKIPLALTDLLPLSTEEAFKSMNLVLSHNITSSIIFKGNDEVLDPFKINKNQIIRSDQYNNRNNFEELNIHSSNSYDKNLLSYVTDWVKNVVIKFTKLNDLENQESIIAKGADSIATIQIVTDLERALRNINSKVRINKTIVFDKPSISTLSQYIYDQFTQELEQLFLSENNNKETNNNLKDNLGVTVDTNTGTTKPKCNYKKDDIAIIGIAGQFPAADSIEEFWRNISQGKNCVEPIPEERWDWRQFYNPDPKFEGSSYGRHGGFIKSIKHFDPLFFNISPADAEKIDPQERLILQNTYHAIQDSCYTPAALEDTGVFISVMYGHYTLYNHSKYVIDSSYASIANRLSYFFNFKGPSLSIDTMCSGGLTALHLACQSINNGDCSSAVVGGVNLMPHPVKYRLLSQGRFLSPTGKCHSFSTDADGYVPGEGVIVFILKNIAKAIEERDRIYGIVRGTAINSGGRSADYTAPSASAQAKVISKAIEKSTVPIESITYFETHGTGTSLGDPIEIDGLTKAYKINQKNYCAIGAVKTNIGHLESAAGLAGIIKILLQFKHKIIVPTINCNNENPLLHLNETPFYIVKESVKWVTPNNNPRRAGVSSFGAGGSNAHAILEEAPNSEESIKELPMYILPISGKTIKAFKSNIESFEKYLIDKQSISLYALCYSATCGREHFRYRYSIIFSTLSELIQKLKQALYVNNLEQFKTIPKGVRDDLVSLKEQLNDNPSEDLYKQLLEQVNESYLNGFDIPWDIIYKQRVPSSLPLYNFDLKEYWSRDFEFSIQSFAQNLSDTSITYHPENYGYKKSLESIYYLVPNFVETPLFNKENQENLSHILFIGNFENEALSPIFSSKLIQYRKIKFLDASLLEHSINGFIANHPLTKLRLKVIINLQQVEVVEPNAYINFFYQLLKLFITNNIRADFIVITNKLDNVSYAYHASLTGLFKSISLENEYIRTKCISFLPSITFKNLATLIFNESSFFHQKFEEITYKEDIRYIKVYKSDNSLVSTETRELFKNNGLYIISGGLGKLGQVLSTFLLKKYNANIVLLGSSELVDQKKQDLLQLESIGGKIIYKKIDITNLRQVEHCIYEITNQFGSINGVIHAAGRIRDKIFITKAFDDFKEVIHVKTQGAIILDKATAAQPLDFFINFSSIASVYGSIGQADYAMGNAFLDAFASIRNEWVKTGERYGLTLSINWPLWSEGGMQISSDKINFIFEQQGILPLSNKEGTAIFLSLISKISDKNFAQIMPVKGQLLKIEAFLNNSLLSRSNLSTQANSNTNPDRLLYIQRHILQFISDILKIDIVNIDIESSFGEYGFTSLSLQVLSDKIKQVFSLGVPPSAFFTFNTPIKIINYLNDKLPELVITEAATLSLVEESSKISDALPNDNTNPVTTNNKYQKKGAYSIIGIDGIMPGASSIEDFWNNMKQKINPITSIPRWNHQQYFGGLVPKMEWFDAQFFSLSAREAMLMDPQHRLFLQVAYNTILDAGYNPNAIHKVGVFVGVQFNDYQILLQQWKQSRHPYAATGNAHAMLANRVSYLLNFNGPSQTIDTACSSALIALRRAMLALEHNECDYALVGAVSLLIDHEVMDAAKSMGVLSASYRCATFDEAADGYVRGEGVGCVLLRRLEDAEKAGDHTYGIIVSCAENHGGRSHSLTAPNPEAQKALLRTAYKDPALARQISYIEAHGTGTKLGDPIEIDALKMAWQEMNLWDTKPSIALGSVKTHIGHLEPAAGMASLLKVLLSLKHKILPTNLHFNKLNPFIDIKNSPFYVINENEPWQSDGPRVAGISSFGFGGSNAHIVVREADKREITLPPPKPFYLVCISAKNKWSLKQLGKNLLDYLSNLKIDDPAYNLANIGYTLNTGRAHFEYRAAWIVATIEDLQSQILKTDFDHIEEVSYKGRSNGILPPWTEQTEYLLQLTQWQLLYLQGHELNWDVLHTAEPKLKLSLPTYPFHTKPYWFEHAADTIMIQEIV